MISRFDHKADDASASEWLSDPYTARVRAAVERDLALQRRNLLGKALSSTDPEVRAVAAGIRATMNMLETLGGKDER